MGHQVALWVPLVVMTRSFVVDAVRGLALIQGRTAFGDATMARSSVTRFLTASRAMRNLYGGAEVTALVSPGLLVTLARLEAQGGVSMARPALGALETTAGLSVLAAVALCLARGIPVVADAGTYLAGGLPGAGRAGQR